MKVCVSPPCVPRLLPAGLRSAAQSSGLAEMAVQLYLNQRQHLCPHLWVPILKPRRPCIRPPDLPTPPAPFVLEEEEEDDEILLPVRNKRVFFADSCGFSLTAVRTFSEEEEEESDLELPPSLRGLGAMTEDGYSCTVSTCCPGTRLRLGFPPPSADFRAFRSRLAESMVTLESCSVSGHALQGTVRVRDVSVHKDVRVRVSFDSWLSYRDEACSYLGGRWGGPHTDLFHFDVPVPRVLDAKRKIQFCLFYLPGGHAQPYWDNNRGQNYSVDVCVSSHLCCGNHGNKRA